MSQGAGEQIVLDQDQDQDENQIEIDLGTDEGEGEGGQQTTQTDADKPSGDGRVSNRAIQEGEDDETPEQRRERRREEAKRRRENQKHYAQQDHSVIAALTEALQKTQAQVQQLGGVIEDMSTQRVAETRDHWIRQARRLRAAYAKALEEGTGEQQLDLQEKYNEAVRYAHHFNGELEKRQGARQQQVQEERQQPQPQADEQEDPVRQMTMRNGALFMRKHSWYDPQGGDKDSQLVRKLDQQVFNDGFRPHTREYWVELEKRMSEQGLIDTDDLDGVDERERGRQQQTQQQPRRPDGTFAPKKTAGGPPVGGRVQTGGKQTVTIPPELREYMEQAGIWNDKEKRKRVVTNYFKTLNASQKK